MYAALRLPGLSVMFCNKMADDIWMALELMTNCLSIVHPVCREVVLVLQAFNGEDYHYQEERH